MCTTGDVWHGSLPFTDYRNHNFRYVSEFGFQAFPTLKTVESFTEPEDRNIFSYVMEKHQRNNAANSKIMTYLGQTYRYPTEGLGTLLYTSQLLSAEAMKYGVEHWRPSSRTVHGRDRVAAERLLAGCFLGRLSTTSAAGKALHYYEKRFFAPVLLSCEEKGFLDDPNPNRECRDLNTDTVKSIRLNVSNETMQPQTVTVKWELRNNRSEVLRDGGEVEITVPRNGHRVARYRRTAGSEHVHRPRALCVLPERRDDLRIHRAVLRAEVLRLHRPAAFLPCGGR
jgi:beta-mannosidase